MKPPTDFRGEIRSQLQKQGYTVIGSDQDISDPFTWKIVARKGEYEITIFEKCWTR